MRDPTTWTILQKDGPNHLGLRYNELHEHQMALITSGCVPCRTLGPTCTPHSPPSCTTAGSAHRRSDRERPGCRRPCGGRELGGPSRSRRGWRSSSRPGSSIGSTRTPVRLAYKGFAAVALPLWPCRCGLAAVALPPWPCRIGLAAVALHTKASPLWPCRCGLAAVAVVLCHSKLLQPSAAPATSTLGDPSEPAGRRWAVQAAMSVFRSRSTACSRAVAGRPRRPGPGKAALRSPCTPSRPGWPGLRGGCRASRGPGRAWCGPQQHGL